MENNFSMYSKTAEILKTLAHPVRLCIVRGLMNKPQCNVTYMQECLDLPQSTVSQHLQKLRSMGIVRTERKGLEVCYSLANEDVRKLITIFFEEE